MDAERKKRERERRERERDAKMVNARKETRLSQRVKRPLFDKNLIENPLILCRETGDNLEVIVDERLSKELQQHQRNGVEAMYNVVSKYGVPPNEKTKHGFILADKQGLGNYRITENHC